MPFDRIRYAALALALVVPTGALHPEVPAVQAADAAVPAPLTQADPGSALDTDGDADADATDLGTGMASYYGRKFDGHPTASGETFDMTELTAAHRTLPFGSRVRVTNLANGKSVVVRINDRGPFHGNRVIDLSRAAAEEIGLVASGRGEVDLTLLDG